MTRAGHRLPRWQRRLLWACALVTLATGLAWLAVHYTVGAGTGELPHPAEAWLMRLHGLGVFGSLFALGVLAGDHVPHGWRMSGRHRWAGQRGTGVTLCACAAAMAATGYLLYYVVGESARPATGWLHSAAGVAMAAVAALHATRARHHRVGYDNNSH
jgi:hypothetical protein